MELTKEMTFEFIAEKKIGHMRCDFNDGKLANTWFGTALAKEEAVDLKDIQETVNTIMFEEIPTFDKLVEMCGGMGYDKEKNLFLVQGDYNYWIRLLPAKGDYNLYINVYNQ